MNSLYCDHMSTWCSVEFLGCQLGVIDCTSGCKLLDPPVLRLYQNEPHTNSDEHIPIKDVAAAKIDKVH